MLMKVTLLVTSSKHVCYLIVIVFAVGMANVLPHVAIGQQCIHHSHSEKLAVI